MGGPLVLGDPLDPGGGPLRLGAPVSPVTDAAAPARLRVHDGFGFVILDNPPDNLLDHATRLAVAAALDRAGRDPQVRAIILIGARRTFCGGRDQAEGAGAAPSAAALCDMVEASARPVIAAIAGQAHGAGAELALAAHYRIAAQGARLGFPDAALGLPPGAGGTQRLPRLVGPRAALALLLDAQPVTASRAQGIGLVDAVTDGDLAGAARGFAAGLLENGAGPRPTRGLRRHSADAAEWMQAVAERRAAAAGPAAGLHAGIADCVEAALLLRFGAGIAYEQEIFAQALADPRGQALRHLHVAERRIDPELLFLPGLAPGAALPAFDERGEAVLARLRIAFDRAVAWLVRTGLSQPSVDAALLVYGYARAPFGNTAGQAEAGDAVMVARRCLAALVAEGARLVEAGAVARPSDIDALAVHGLGFPGARGGPMRAAEEAGLLALRRDMAEWAAEDPVWAPPRLLSEAAVAGRSFSALQPDG